MASGTAPVEGSLDTSLRPSLRPVETIVVPDPRHGRVLVLRDTQGVTRDHAVIPGAWLPIVARFDGRATCEEIARAVSQEIGAEVPRARVEQLAKELDAALFLEGRRYREALARVKRAFEDAEVRPASHAGGAYAGEADALRRYLDGQCLEAAARTNGHAAPPGAVLRALIAPHIDPWRGAIGYGHAYGTLRDALARQPDVDTFVLLGTSHAPMRQPFALCRKAFDTPLGLLEADLGAIDALAAAAPFDAYEDQFNHKREHSLEFQAVFLRHLLGDRPARIVPVLASLGEHQARGTDPQSDGGVGTFLDAITGLVGARDGRAIVVAGADLAHVGPRFGDARPGAEQRAILDATDRASLAHATHLAPRDFWRHVAADLDTRRVCGLAPIYSTLRTLPPGTRGDLLHYEQTVDAEDGSIVSHAAVAFYG